MEETAALDEGAVHLLPPELGVRPRLACKAEGAVPRGIQGDKGQSGEGGGGEADAPGLDSSPAQGLQKEAAEGILIEHCILRPDIRKNMMNPKLRCGFQIFFIILHVHTVKDSGIFRIMNLDASVLPPTSSPAAVPVFSKEQMASSR